MRRVSHRKMEGVSTGLFPAEAGPTDTALAHCVTGFSRECVRCRTAKSRVCPPASSRLKPVPLTHWRRRCICWQMDCGSELAREEAKTSARFSAARMPSSRASSHTWTGCAGRLHSTPGKPAAVTAVITAPTGPLHASACHALARRLRRSNRRCYAAAGRGRGSCRQSSRPS
jgi:hypothetical protein